MIHFHCSSESNRLRGTVGVFYKDVPKSLRLKTRKPLCGATLRLPHLSGAGRVLVRQREQLHQPDGSHHQVLRRAGLREARTKQKRLKRRQSVPYKGALFPLCACSQAQRGFLHAAAARVYVFEGELSCPSCTKFRARRLAYSPFHAIILKNAFIRYHPYQRPHGPMR